MMSRQKLSAKKWLKQLLFIILICLVCMMMISYMIDPYLLYRVKDNKYLLHSRFVTPGLIKNYDYDTVIVGSSMIQNFNMDSFRSKMGYKPLKVTMNNMSLAEINAMCSLVSKCGKADNYFICIDLPLYSDRDTTRCVYPDYLIDDNRFNDYRYLLGYETWMRFIPVDILLSILRTLHIDLPEKYTKSLSIDRLEEWQLNFDFGRDATIQNYLSSPHNVSSINQENLYDKMIGNINLMLNSLDLFEGNYTFFFPPYSALFWHSAKDEGYYDVYMKVKKHIISYLEEYDNIKIYDFQSAEFIVDLDNYKDFTHYSPEINEWMVDCFSKGTYTVNSTNIDHNILVLNAITDEFSEENKDWLYDSRYEH